MIKENAINTIKMELEEANKLLYRIDDTFEAAARCILECSGRVIVTGMGKSGHIGRKIAATLASTGTLAFFMHPAEAFHGDLGMVSDKDVVIAISNSGESSEIVNILPIIGRIGAKIIAFCGRKESNLGKFSNFYIDISVRKEADPLGLAPTSSTTNTLIMGDALAMALLTERKFTAQDFALYHPGGSLGRKLLLTVNDVMHSGEDNPVIRLGKTIKEALFIMTSKGLGAVSVVDEDNIFVGLITDGMVRRSLEEDNNLLNQNVEKIMVKNPLTIPAGEMAVSALRIMEKHQPRPVTALPVIYLNKHVVGMIHITDLLHKGII